MTTTCYFGDAGRGST